MKLFTPLIVAFLMIHCNSGAGLQELLGAGATFPYPLYSKFFYIYNDEFGVKINYQPIGSGGGIQQLLNKTVDFGATDAFMSSKDLKESKKTIVHVPTCLGGVVVTYNLPGNPTLKFTRKALSDIFLSKITTWNDSAILSVNQNVKLPAIPITIIHRSDGSGTSFIFTDFLSKISCNWQSTVGAGKSVKWPAGLGAKGNEGIVGMIKQIPGSIGYCELAYALQNNMPLGRIQNRNGRFIKPDLISLSKAADISIPTDTRINLTDTEAEDGYPISSFTWLILYKEQAYDNHSKEKAQAIVMLLWWIIHDGQKFTIKLEYAPLPKTAVEKAENVVRSVVFNGTRLTDY